MSLTLLACKVARSSPVIPLGLEFSLYFEPLSWQVVLSAAIDVLQLAFTFLLSLDLLGL